MFDLEAAESLVPESFVNHVHEVVVHQVPVLVGFPVVYVDVWESVDVEIHLVVGTHPVVIYSEQGELGKYVVDCGDGHSGLTFLAYGVCDHVGRGMAELNHGFVNSQPLCRSLQRMLFQKRLELFYAVSMIFDVLARRFCQLFVLCATVNAESRILPAKI